MGSSHNPAMFVSAACPRSLVSSKVQIMSSNYKLNKWRSIDIFDWWRSNTVHCPELRYISNQQWDPRGGEARLQNGFFAPSIWDGGELRKVNKICIRKENVLKKVILPKILEFFRARGHGPPGTPSLRACTWYSHGRRQFLRLETSTCPDYRQTSQPAWQW